MKHSNNNQQTCWHHAKSWRTTCLDEKTQHFKQFAIRRQTKMATETDISWEITFATYAHLLNANFHLSAEKKEPGFLWRQQINLLFLDCISTECPSGLTVVSQKGLGRSLAVWCSGLRAACTRITDATVIATVALSQRMTTVHASLNTARGEKVRLN